jgi:hypothetical protein
MVSKEIIFGLIPKESAVLFAALIIAFLAFNGSISVPSQGASMIAFLIASYFVLGAGIKYVDDAFDERVFNKKRAVFFSPVLGILWAYSMVVSPESATLLGAILVSVIIKLKIDNIGHQIGALSIIAVLGGLYFLGLVQFLWLPLIIVSIIAIIDEINRDYLRKHYVKSNALFRFLRGRYLADISVFFLALFNFIPFVYFIAFYFFGIGYDVVTKRGAQLKVSWKFAVNSAKSHNIFLVH